MKHAEKTMAADAERGLLKDRRASIALTSGSPISSDAFGLQITEEELEEVFDELVNSLPPEQALGTEEAVANESSVLVPLHDETRGFMKRLAEENLSGRLKDARDRVIESLKELDWELQDVLGGPHRGGDGGGSGDG
eukprot:3729504-Prymnesium_polylepis.1